MAESESSDRSAWWLAVVGVAGAITGAMITGSFSYLGQKGDVDEKMIELSISILQSNPKPETTPLRDFAIDTMEKRGGFTFTDQQRKVLESQPLPMSSALAPATIRWLCRLPSGTECAAASGGQIGGPCSCAGQAGESVPGTYE